MNGCPVLNELAVTEDYDREYENAPVLSGGDYDISAIRSCGEDCLLGAYAWQRQERIWGIAVILGLSSGDASEIEDTIRETLRSRDEWLEQATKNAARIEELTAEALQLQGVLRAKLAPLSIESDPAYRGIQISPGIPQGKIRATCWTCGASQLFEGGHDGASFSPMNEFVKVHQHLTQGLHP